MEKFILLLILISGTLNTQERLNGVYLMKFEEKYSYLDGKLTIEGNSYIRNQNNQTVKGIVVHDEKIIILKDKHSKLKVELYIDDIQNDTIQFRTSELGEVKDEGDILLYLGKMIRVKSDK